MTKKIAEEIIHLLKDMSSGNVSSEWGDITKSAVAEAILNLTRIEEAHRYENHKNMVLRFNFHTSTISAFFFTS